MLSTRRALRMQLITIVVVIVLLVVLSRTFRLVEIIGHAQEAVMQWGPWGAVCYPFLFALCNILLLPGGILCVGSGFFFGLWWGFFLVLVGNAIGAAVAFTLSRSVSEMWFRRRLSRN